MTLPTDRDARDEILVRLVLGDLPAAEAETLRTMLAHDPALAREVRSLRATLDQLPYATVTAPPPHLRARVLHAAGTAPRPSATPPATTRGPVVTWRRVVGALAAGLALQLVWDNGRLRRDLALQRDVMTTLQQPNVLLSFALAGTGGGSGAFGSVVLDLDAKKAAVVIRDLAPAPPDHTYRLWAQVGDRKVPCGDLRIAPDGTVSAQIPIPVDAYTAPVRELLLTLETRADTDAPHGPTVMRGT